MNEHSGFLRQPCGSWEGVFLRDEGSQRHSTNLSDSVVFTLLVLTKGVKASSLEELSRPVEEL